MRSGEIFQFHKKKKIHFFFLVILQLFVLSSSDRWAVTHRYIHKMYKFLEIKFSPPRNKKQRREKTYVQQRIDFIAINLIWPAHCVLKSKLFTRTKYLDKPTYRVKCSQIFDALSSYDYFIRHSLITLMRLFSRAHTHTRTHRKEMGEHALQYEN